MAKNKSKNGNRKHGRNKRTYRKGGASVTDKTARRQSRESKRLRSQEYRADMMRQGHVYGRKAKRAKARISK